MNNLNEYIKDQCKDMNAEEKMRTLIQSTLLQVFSEVEQITGPLPNAYIAGGCIASIILGEEVKDYDIWFETPEDVKLAIGTVMDHSENYKYCTDVSKYAHTIKLSSGKVIQLVESRLGPAEVIVPGFDFKHTQSYMKRDGTLVADIEFIKKKRLVFSEGNFKHPVNTMQRVYKFARRGYDIPFETTKALMVACTSLDPEAIGKSDTHGGSL